MEVFFMKKKILALIFALVLVLGTVVFVYADDVADAVNLNAIVEQLGLPENTTLFYYENDGNSTIYGFFTDGGFFITD